MRARQREESIRNARRKEKGGRKETEEEGGEEQKSAQTHQLVQDQGKPFLDLYSLRLPSL